MSRPACRTIPYDLELKRPWRSAAGILVRRSGRLVVLETGYATGYGDCAPMPSIGTESTAAADAWLLEQCGSLPPDDPERCLARLPRATHCPAARCALETALLDLLAKRQRKPLRRLLADQAGDKVRINASIGSLDDGIALRALSACKAGYELLKVKVGIAPVDEELSALSGLCHQLPGTIRLRLDASRAWEETDARRFIRGIQDLPVESIEEPLRDPHHGRLEALQAEAACDLAVDESLPGLLAEITTGAFPVRRVVLKAALLGGLLPALELAAAAAGQGIGCVVTNTLQSAAGRWADLQLAAAVDALAGAGVHGLATGSWLARDLARTSPPEGALVHLDRTPGSGFSPLAER